MTITGSLRVEDPRLSPDGRWLACDSDETGQLEVYVRAYPGLGQRTQVSSGGGVAPVWAPDGRRLYFQQSSANPHLLRAELAPGPTPASPLVVAARGEVAGPGGAPTDWQTAGPADFDVRPDGKGFVLLRPAGDRQQEIMYVQHWRRELDERTAAH